MKAINQQAKKVMDLLITDVGKIGDHKEVNNTTFMPVHIECICRCNYGLLYSIAHYFNQNGDYVCDPDMVFIKAETDGNYYPVSFEQGGVIRKEAVIFETKTAQAVRKKEQRDQATFANRWMRNIKEQQGLVI